MTRVGRDLMEVVLEVVRKGAPMSTEAVRSAVDAHPVSVSEALRRLRADGLIERTGPGGPAGAGWAPTQAASLLPEPDEVGHAAVMQAVEVVRAEGSAPTSKVSKALGISHRAAWLRLRCAQRWGLLRFESSRWMEVV